MSVLPLFTATALSITPHFGVGQGEFEWNIGGGANTNTAPNILSELEYNDLDSRYVGIDIDGYTAFTRGTGLFYEFRYLKGEVKKGESIDSDYLLNDREYLFSKSTAEVRDGKLDTTEISIGIQNCIWSQTNTITLLVGYREDTQSFTSTNGVQEVAYDFESEEFGNPGKISLEGLDSEYAANWKSVFVGLALNYYYGRHGTSFRYTYNDADYSAIADWNLREDLKHPESFDQSGKGWGNTYEFSYYLNLSKRTDLRVTYCVEEWKVKNGYDRVHFIDGVSVVTLLKEVSWDSQRIDLGIRFSF